MQKAEPILQAMRKLGEQGQPLTRVYRLLYSEALFLKAYDKIGRNQGALTPGTEPDTADGMKRHRIQSIINQLRTERFHFRPVRQIQIPKKKGGTRPLGMPNFTEKLVEEAIRLLLDAYYEPQFRNSAHGFRPGRGCHTALAEIQHRFTGTVWFIEGDIAACFSSLDHDILIKLLARNIHDGRLLNLIGRHLKAGYLENWQYHHTHSGVPQGSVLSPLLSNIYLTELDAFVEDTLIPTYTRGQRRASNPAYNQLTYQIYCARKQGDQAMVRQLEQQRRDLPSQDPTDPHFRRLRYIRYADDVRRR